MLFCIKQQKLIFFFFSFSLNLSVSSHMYVSTLSKELKYLATCTEKSIHCYIYLTQ